MYVDENTNEFVYVDKTYVVTLTSDPDLPVRSYCSIVVQLAPIS